jgi:polysaccharide deacetylase 2 family uncharacterized protein YibQ
MVEISKRKLAEGTQAKRRSSAPLLIFWGIVATIAVAGIAVLQYLGPPPAPLVAADFHHGAATAKLASKPQKIASATLPAKPSAAKPSAASPAAASPAAAQPKAPPAESLLAMGTGSTLAAGSPIPAPMAKLLAPAASNPNWLVPRIGPDGTTPMRAYSASAAAAPGPHVAVLVAGVGDDDAQSQEAVTSLPAAISLAITPYGQHISEIAGLARASGHETLLAIPMQEANPATENAGNEALVMAGPITVDQPMLDWSLAQIQGYAGVTDAIGVTQGAGFMANPNAKAWLLQEIADKGLFFIDALQTGATPYAWSRTADVVIDPVSAPQNEQAQLAQLAADAKLHGDALGILLHPAPTALQTLSSWTQSLASQGISLVPVSALVLPPYAPPAATAAAGAPGTAATP